MDSKETLEELVERIEFLTGQNRKDIAVGLNYGKTYISEMLGPNGKVSDKFVAQLKMKYADCLALPTPTKMTTAAPVLPETAVNPMDLMRLLFENSENLKTALDVHKALVREHGELTKANSELALSNRRLSEAAKLHIERSISLRTDGDPIIPKDVERQKSSLHNLAKDELKKKKGRRDGNPRNED